MSPQPIYLPRTYNPWEQYLPQFLSNIILQDQSQKFRQRMMESEQARESEQAKELGRMKLATTEGVSEVPTEPYAASSGGNVFTAYGKQYSYNSPKSALPPGYYKAGESLYKDVGGGKLEPVKDKELSVDMQTIYGPNGATKRIAIPKTGEYTPPSGWSLNAPEKAKEEKDEAVSDLKKFELVQWGRLRPDMRGTPEYQSLYKKFKQSPFTDALERQIELTAKTQGTALRKEFYDSPEVKTYQTISQQFGVMQEAVKESKGENLVAVDQALITIMNKMMDPQSVVRESEYARTPGDLALMNRIKGAYQKIQKGGAGLTDDDRKAIAKIGKKYYEVSQKKYKSKFHEYTGYLSNYGLNPEVYLNPSDKGIGASANPLDKYME